MSKSLVVIPARMASTRLPGKPLSFIGDKTLIQRVWEQGQKVNAVDTVVIATDSPEIVDAGAAFGATVISTSRLNRTGSDRVAEVYRQYKAKGQDFSFIANVQGDMPFIKPSIIEQAFTALKQSPQDVGMVTIATPITNEEEFFRPSVVKVVTGASDQALYFSRAPIPYPRNRTSEVFGHKHIGLYVFRPEVLEKMEALSSVVTEEAEGLEQLRLLAHGFKIGVTIVPRELLEPSVEVDTPEDLAVANEIAANNQW